MHLHVEFIHKQNNDGVKLTMYASFFVASFTNGGFTDIRPINEKSVIDETAMVDNSSQQGDDIRL